MHVGAVNEFNKFLDSVLGFLWDIPDEIGA